jgi:hypothetical protein
LEQYQEQQSSEQFEQQPGEYEEGKYNMNILSLFNTIPYCILILYAYKDFPSMTSLGMISVGQGRVPFHGPTIRKSIGPWHGEGRVFRDIT